MNIDDERILERYQSPRFQGAIEGSSVVSAHGDNPFCGDEITWTLELREGEGETVVARARWRGFGCSLCLATADFAAELIEGMSVSQVRDMSEDGIFGRWGGLEVGRSRRRCVELPLSLLKQAVAGG